MVFAPGSVLALIAFMLALHAYRALWLGIYEDADIALLKPTAFVAARFSIMTGVATISDVLKDVASAAPELRPMKRFLASAFLGAGETAPWTLVTYAFLHAGWEHVIFNALWLLVFGSPVMQRFGPLRFAPFFAITAAAAAVAHALNNPTDVSVLVGASGAVSGLTAAALRFAFVGPGFGLGYGPHVIRQPAPPLLVALQDRRVLVFVAVWFGLNLMAGLGIPVAGSVDVRIAWEAHVGGFLAGLLVFPLFDPVK
jgi:membrane associated rhomboid family serine protease